MEAKGLAVVTIEQFVREKGNQPAVDRWFDALPPASREILRERIVASAWYPATHALITPTQVVCDQHYGGDARGAWELGRASAEYGLRGPYKLWSMVASPTMLISRAARLIQSYYRPVELTLENQSDHGGELHLTGIDPPTPLVAARIAGWVERALEISGTRSVEITIERSATTPRETTVIVGRWE